MRSKMRTQWICASTAIMFGWAAAAAGVVRAEPLLTQGIGLQSCGKSRQASSPAPASITCRTRSCSIGFRVT